MDEENGYELMLVETKPCRVCGKQSKLKIPAFGFYLWQDGALVQHAFPGLTADERELLISGTHSACYEQLCKERDGNFKKG